MTNKLLSLLLISISTIGMIVAQNVTLEGYVFEDNNRGYLNAVEVVILDNSSRAVIQKTTSNKEGFFSADIPIGKKFLVKLSRDLYFPMEEVVSTVGKSASEKVYVKSKLERKPGYIFDVTLAEAGNSTNVNAITGSKIEVYNNTLDKETLVIEDLGEPNFNVTFERGNHYSVLIRKEGFFNKRLEAYVDIEGCILCFEGVGTVEPGVSDVMSRGFKMGSVLANIELEPAQVGRTIVIENIYYDYNDSSIQPEAAAELNKLTGVLVDNPSIILEVGSHTDSRGGDESNLKLSQERAEAVVDHIITKGRISPTRLKAQGYGETQPVNDCDKRRKKCSEAEHAANRRTSLRVLGFEEHDPYADRSLQEILTEERLLREIEDSGVIEIPKDGAPPKNKH